jgi:hypothetical protein
MAKSGDFEVADSSCRFCGIGHILGESAISEYIKELATSKLLLLVL